MAQDGRDFFACELADTTHATPKSFFPCRARLYDQSCYMLPGMVATTGPAGARPVWQEPPCCWPVVVPCSGSSAIAHLGQERWLGKMLPMSSYEVCSSQGPSAGLAPFPHSMQGLKGCVCKHQAPTGCLRGAGQEAREGSERRQTALRGCGVRLLLWRRHTLQLIVVVGVTYSTRRSQHYFMAP